LIELEQLARPDNFLGQSEGIHGRRRNEVHHSFSFPVIADKMASDETQNHAVLEL
jgi:hypothetical protein